MKHLKSSSQDLRQMFDQNIPVRTIAESLASFDAISSAEDVELFMKQRDFDVIGVRVNGIIDGYVHREEIKQGKIGDHIIKFETSELVNDTDSLLSVFNKFQDSRNLFVISMGQVIGIVTLGDLQKIPVRMWLFGLISLIEMQLLRIIRNTYPNDEWQNYLSSGRLEKTFEIMRERQKRNEAIDLADCLQFGDKRDIVVKNKSLIYALGLDSKSKGISLLKELERLRDNLAHAQNITESSQQLINLVDRAEKLLQHSEMV